MLGPKELSKIHTVRNRTIKTSVSQYWRKKKKGFKQYFVVYPQAVGVDKMGDDKLFSDYH